MICLRCGTQNPAGRNYCANCNAVLPRMDETYVVSVPTISGRLERIREQAQNAVNGIISPQDFAVFIAQTSAELALKAHEIRESAESDNYWESAPEEMDAGLAGIQNFEAGLMELMAYTGDLDPHHIENGLELLQQGNQMINEAMRVNREARHRTEIGEE